MGASAHIETGVSSVRAHTDRADAALDRAVALFEQNRDGRAERSFNRSRREMGQATAEAARLRRTADNGSLRAEAARAQALVADQRDENIEQLTSVLDEADGRVELKVAKAALADTRGRDRSIAVIAALLEQGVPSGAASVLAERLAALSHNRAPEVRKEAKALVCSSAITGCAVLEDVSRASKWKVARSVEVNLDGQERAAQQLAELIESSTMPEESKPGLQRAYDAVVAEHGSIANILSRFSDRMPDRIRSFVEYVIAEAREDARNMRERRPTPPAGPPSGTPTGS